MICEHERLWNFFFLGGTCATRLMRTCWLGEIGTILSLHDMSKRQMYDLRSRRSTVDCDMCNLCKVHSRRNAPQPIRLARARLLPRTCPVRYYNSIYCCSHRCRMTRYWRECLNAATWFSNLVSYVYLLNKKPSEQTTVVHPHECHLICMTVPRRHGPARCCSHRVRRPASTSSLQNMNKKT